MLLATPISAVMLFVGWLLLTNVIFPLKIEGSDETTKSLEQMYASLGKVSTDERRVFYIFVMTALAWMSSKVFGSYSFPRRFN